MHPKDLCLHNLPRSSPIWVYTVCYGAVWSGSTLLAKEQSDLNLHCLLWSSLMWVYTVCQGAVSDLGLLCLPRSSLIWVYTVCYGAVWSGSPLFAMEQSDLGLYCLLWSSLIWVYTVCYGAVWSGSTLFAMEQNFIWHLKIQSEMNSVSIKISDESNPSFKTGPFTEPFTIVWICDFPKIWNLSHDVRRGTLLLCCQWSVKWKYDQHMCTGIQLGQGCD